MKVIIEGAAMDEQERRRYYQLARQYLWARRELEIAHREWMRRKKINDVVSRIKIIAVAIVIIALMSFLVGIGWHLTSV